MHDLVVNARLSPTEVLLHPVRVLYPQPPSFTDDRSARTWKKLRTRSRYAIVRCIFLGCFTVACALWRLSLNGGTKPQLIEAQNPAGFAQDRFVRFASVSWQYVLNIRLLVFPMFGGGQLCCDWSADSIPLVKTSSDPRFVGVLCFYIMLGVALHQMLSPSSNPKAMGLRCGQRRCFMAAAFIVLPFILSANILFPVGFAIAERVLYLPSAGVCMLFGHGFDVLLRGSVAWELCDGPLIHICGQSTPETNRESDASAGAKTNVDVKDENGNKDSPIDPRDAANCEIKGAGTELDTNEGTNGHAEMRVNACDYPLSEQEAGNDLPAPLDTRSSTHHFPQPDCAWQQPYVCGTANGNVPPVQRGALWGVLVAMCAVQWHMTATRSVEWGNPLLLWESARRVNPVSAHAAHNVGLELSWAQRQVEATAAFRFSLKKNKHDHATRLALALSLRHIKKCPAALKVLRRGNKLLKPKIERAAKGLLDTREMSTLKRDQSSYMAAEALCINDVPKMGKMLYAAVQLDPTNEFAVQQATDLLKLAQQAGMVQQAS
eukprot:g752.t1